MVEPISTPGFTNCVGTKTIEASGHSPSTPIIEDANKELIPGQRLLALISSILLVLITLYMIMRKRIDIGLQKTNSQCSNFIAGLLEKTSNILAHSRARGSGFMGRKSVRLVKVTKVGQICFGYAF